MLIRCPWLYKPLPLSPWAISQTTVRCPVLSLCLQLIDIISLSAPHRKRLLLAFGFFGAIAAMMFLLLPSSSPIWPASALLGICANVGFGASVVAMNAYLPTLARASEEVVVRFAQLHAGAGATSAPVASRQDSASSPLLADEPDQEDVSALRTAYNTALSRATSRISSQGIALGYAAGILMLFVALIPVTLLHGTTFALRLAIGLSGAWWALFSLPSAAWLPSGAVADAEWADEAEEGEDASMETKTWSTRREIGKAWKRLGGMLRWREIKRLRYTFQYLAAWFLLSDGQYTSAQRECRESKLTKANIFPPRFYDHYVYRDSLRQDQPAYATIVTHYHRHRQPHVWHHGFAHMAHDTASLWLDEPARSRDTSVSSQLAACLRMSWFHSRLP